ncbi:MAG: nucleoside hydrolase [Spirochaetaceae bacterium]|nr:nucleoside hydrolase [Spirochaetaceae bacterium]
MKKIIIDCDPGHDDATAIMLAYSFAKKVELLGITTVCGNNTVENVTANARRIVAVCGKSTQVYRGASRPLINKLNVSAKYHGESGMDGPEYDANLTLPPENPMSAIEFMRDTLVKAVEPVSIAAIGPLTNIALLLRSCPDVIEKIECISLMGGGIAHGNITPFAEFNIYVDPEAAEIVFSSGIPIVMSGLDLTEQAVLAGGSFEHLRRGGRAGKFFCELMDFYGRSAEEFGVDGCMLHDPCALLWLIFPDIFSGRRGDVNVVLCGEQRGRTVFRENSAGTVLALQKLDLQRFCKTIIEAIARLDSEPRGAE